MKVTIIGGGGRVGSNAAFALQCAGIVSEIQILDANTEMAEGEALDLMHGTSCMPVNDLSWSAWEAAPSTTKRSPNCAAQLQSEHERSRSQD